MNGHTVFSLHWILLIVNHVVCIDYELYEFLNRSEPVKRQLYEFKLDHPKPVGILTTSAGQLVEIRDTNIINSDVLSSQYFVNMLSYFNTEKIPERVVHAKGAGAFGYFEVTHNVSKYTKADVFNGIGKKTPVVARFSSTTQNLGGNDLTREQKGLVFRFFTKEGNLDYLCISFPILLFNDPVQTNSIFHTFKKNPRTNVNDHTNTWDYTTMRAERIHATLWQLSDFGIPNGYRKSDAFPIHTYIIYNKQGDKYFAKFNFRTNQGVEHLSSEVAATIASRDLDYFVRDLYNAIENKDYPSWSLEMDILSMENIDKLDYNPFDLTREWRKGTYKTVPIGRFILNRNPENFFRDVELSAFNPANLVPGINAPPDAIFKARRSSYRETQVYRLGVNHNRIEVNKPFYSKIYNRDGVPPVGTNMKDAPNYYPNSFNGPVPYVDASRPNERFIIYDSNAVDLQPAANFYNERLTCDGQRERLVNNTVNTLLEVSPDLRRRVIRLLKLVDRRLGSNVAKNLKWALHIPSTPPPPVLKCNL